MFENESDVEYLSSKKTNLGHGLSLFSEKGELNMALEEFTMASSHLGSMAAKRQADREQ